MSKYTKDVIPSQNALKMAISLLRMNQNIQLGNAIAYLYQEKTTEGTAARLLADDFDQVATYLEARMVVKETPPVKGKHI